MDDIMRIIDPERQKSYKRDYPTIFRPNEKQIEYLMKSEGWHTQSVNCALSNIYHKYVEMNVLRIENLIFYRPIKPLNNAEFEYFFRFGSKCEGFSVDKIRFSYGIL